MFEENTSKAEVFFNCDDFKYNVMKILYDTKIRSHIHSPDEALGAHHIACRAVHTIYMVRRTESGRSVSSQWISEGIACTNNSIHFT